MMANLSNRADDHVMNLGLMSTQVGFDEQITELRETIGVNDPEVNIQMINAAANLSTVQVIRLEINTGELRLAFRRSDFYLVGFLGDSKWFELPESKHHNHSHQIQGSVLLPLYQSYGPLHKHAGKRVVGATLFAPCVEYLSSLQEEKTFPKFMLSTIAKYVVLISLLIPESARFCLVSDFVKSKLKLSEEEEEESWPEPVDYWVEKLMTKWSQLSEIARRYQGTDVGEEPIELTGHGLVSVMRLVGGRMIAGQISTVGDVRDALGLMTYKPQ